MSSGLHKSYVATRLGPWGRLDEARNLYLVHKLDVRKNVGRLLEEAAFFRGEIEGLRGEPMSGLEILEIGPGQQFVELVYFGIDNDVTGIDTDLLAARQGFVTTVQMLRRNGLLRTAKTTLRKIIGVDRNTRRELALQLGVGKLPSPKLYQMDAGNTTFPNESFDVIYSRAVFEHLTDPATVIAEIHRILRPGGVMFIRLHLYTSDSGIHDTRIFANRRDHLPFWSHLRPEHALKVRPNSFLNGIRLRDWTELFTCQMPSCRVTARCDAPDSERRELAKLRQANELGEYSDEELLSPTVDIVWRKPENI